MIIKELLAVVGLDFDDKAVDDAEKGIEDLIDGVRALGAAFLANEVVQGIAGFIGGITHASRELDLNAQRLGITTAQMQQLGLVAADAGQDIDLAVDAVSTLQERMRDSVQDRASDPAKQLRRLGIEIPRTVAEMPDAITLFRQAADGLAAMENQTDRVGAAMTVFGDVGRELLPVLQQGGSVIDQYAAELEMLGGGISEEVVESSREMLAQQARLNLAFDSLKSLIGAEILPRLADMAVRAVQLAAGFVEVARESNIVKAAIIVLSGVLAGVGASMAVAYAAPLGMFLLIAGSIAVLILLVDDLITLFEGGDSVIGRFIDSMFGLGTAERWVRNLTEAWNGLTLAIRRAYAAITGGEEPDDGIANEQLSPEEARRRQRLAAARQGRVVGDRGQSFEEALASTNQIREQEGLPPLERRADGTIAPTEQAPERSARARSRRRPSALRDEPVTGVRQPSAFVPSGPAARALTQTNQLNIRIDGSADQNTVREIERVVERTMGRHNREALDSLSEEAED